MAKALQEIMSLWSRGDRAAALELSASQFDEQVGDEEVALLHSGLLLHQSDYASARATLELSLSYCPGSPRLAVNLSIARRGCGDLEGALSAAREAVDLAPELVSAWNALGIALIELGRADEAERSLSEGLALHPDSAPLALHLDQVIRQQGRTRDGARDHGRALMAQAEALIKSGNTVAAETLLRQALKLYPEHAAAHTNLGVFLMQFERKAEAAQAFRSALERNPACETSRFLLQVTEGEFPESGSASYVQMLFDSYADHFDQELVEALDYRAPELLAKRVLARSANTGLGEVLDMGCGTGLMAIQLVGHFAAIDGVDLSSRMLEKARERALYRELAEADIRDYLATSSKSWGAILAADVFCYCGRLDDIFVLARRRLQPHGILAFTVEASEDEDIEVLASTGRYRHGRHYLMNALRIAGFNDCQIEQDVLRKNHDKDVQGYLVLAQS